MSYRGWKPYVPVHKRRAAAQRRMKQLEKQGQTIEPVEISGRKIAHTFWGEAWCNHLEQFSDYENRLPRGRTYARNGSVCHLGIGHGRIEAIVSGSELYTITIAIKPLPASKWKRVRNQCTGQIGSLLELLQGKFSRQVMEIVTHRDHGLFPNPDEIEMQCSCPDWADLCKHLAAVLYGVGARLDQQPELLFKLRGVDHQELITADLDLTATGTGTRRRLADDDLSGLFGVDIDADPVPVTPRPVAAKTATAKTATAKKAAVKKSVAKKAMPKKAVPKKTAPTKAAPKKAAPKKAAPKKAAPKKAAPKKAAPKKAAPKKAAPKKAAPKKAAPKKAAPKKAAPKKAAPKKAAPKKAAPKKAAPKKAAPKKAAPKKAAPKKAAPKKAMPKKPVPKKQ